MNEQIILVAETGSDLTPEQAAQYGIHLVPMHVTMGERTLDDGSFPPEDIFSYYQKTGTAPKTSASTPFDFQKVFDELHEKYPNSHILHLAYSAVTTASYHSAQIAAEGRDYVTSVDTKHVSVGQAAVVIKTAKYLRDHLDITVERLAEKVKEIGAATKMCFIPQNLDYLRAGGRVSNAVALVGNILSLHPCIEILDGKLIAKKKYRGALSKIVPNLIREYTEANRLQKDQLYFIWSQGLPEEIKRLAEKVAAELGFQNVTWMKTGCVISCHGGPGCFGIVGMSEE